MEQKEAAELYAKALGVIDDLAKHSNPHRPGAALQGGILNVLRAMEDARRLRHEVWPDYAYRALGEISDEVVDYVKKRASELAEEDRTRALQVLQGATVAEKP